MKFKYDLTYSPPAPSIEIYLGLADTPLEIGPLKALVDTGADGVVIPFQFIRELDASLYDEKYLETYTGERVIVPIYLLDIRIGNLRLPSVMVAAYENSEELI